MTAEGSDTTWSVVDTSGATLRSTDVSLNTDELGSRCRALAAQIESRGAEPGHPVCYLTPPGGSAAEAFLATSAVAAAAPANPKATDAELVAYVERLEPSLVIVPPDRAGQLEGRVNCEVATWDWSDGPLRVEGANAGADPISMANSDHTALILPTSGTTGTPKQVPLAHRQICRSASNIASWLSLTGGDASLTMMPLFHIHGLVAGLLAPLSMGGTVAVEPFDALRFGSLLELHRPTWYSAVPTMHALIVERWRGRSDELRIDQLRFVRSSSSALAPSLLGALEALLSVPVAEAYGMTEASHQIAANPIEPGARRPGSVGVATGTELRIDRPDSEGQGEVLVRGPQLAREYRNAPEATAEAFVDGWFRTGDEGRMDDGWLTLTGRLKEMINRGGEKISPIEVENALLEVAGVQSCAVFSVPHDQLGEDVGAVVVSSGDFDPGAARRTLRNQLSKHKVPRDFVLVDEIPVGPTGKIQRSRLAAQLGI